MTTPVATSQPPWKVRWAAYGLVLFCLAVIPGPTRALVLTVIDGAAQVAGIDGQDPIEISPTNPPVVDQ